MRWAVALSMAVPFTILAETAFAEPREDCALVVSSLGFATDDYAFEAAGLFTLERHQFGALTCYVRDDGTFDSLYRGDLPIAEDGYFGEEALRERDRLRAEAEAAGQAARSAYETQRAAIDAQLELDLAAVQDASDPLSQRREVSPIPQDMASEPSEDDAATAPDSSSLVAEAPAEPEVSTEDPNSDAALTEVTEMWVAAERLSRRTCPSTDCGIVGRLMFRERTEVIEERDGWARITELYDAACQNSRSAYVEEGNASCDPSNGIEDGRFAEWVSMAYLAAERPANPADTATDAERLVAQSNDFAQYREAFVEAANQLIDEGTCTEADFLEMGGWWASTAQGPTIYFTYCGGSSTANRIYLDAMTGRIFR